MEEEYSFCLEDAYRLIPEEELNYVEPSSSGTSEDSDSESDNRSAEDSESEDVNDEGSERSVESEVKNENCEDDVDVDEDAVLWSLFMGMHYGSGAAEEVTVDEDDEYDPDFECHVSSSESSSDEDENGSSESETDSGGCGSTTTSIPATLPYMNSDSESEGDKDVVAYQSWCKYIKADAVIPHIEIITLDEDEDVIIGEMRCLQCPDGQSSIYKDKGLFLLHRARHKGRNHFVCPTCLKPFIKISYCFAHEVRVHGMSFALQNPLITEAAAYRKKRLELEHDKLLLDGQVSENKKSEDVDDDDDMDPDFFDDIEPPPPRQTKKSDIIVTPYCTNFAGLVLFPEEGEYETEEDDPKFHLDHAVPSTALYPYRGLEPLSIYDCYEIHLRYGRKKRTAANTIARCAMARRRRLIEEGRIAENDLGRFWKPPSVIPPPERASKRKRGADQGTDWETSSCSTTISRKRKRPNNRSSSCDSAEENILAEEKGSSRRKKRKLGHSKKLPPVDTTNRSFVAGVIARTCLLCGFTWATELELKSHRDEKHPKKSIVELMTFVSKKKSKASKLMKSPVSQLKKRRLEESYKPKLLRGIPIPLPTEKERFLGTLGLITQEQCAYLKSLKPPIRGKLCYVKVKKFRIEIPKNGKVYVCPKSKCDYYTKTRDLVTKHIRLKHPTPKCQSLIASNSTSSSSRSSFPFSVSTNPNTLSRKEEDRIRLQELVDLINRRKM